MTVKTKFSIGDTVYRIRRGKVKTWEPCCFCGATGETIGRDETIRDCPECYGRKGRSKWEDEPTWHLCEETPRLTIAVAIVTVEPNEQTETYYCHETGVIYKGQAGCALRQPGDELFPTLEAAQTECYNRNQPPNHKD